MCDETNFEWIFLWGVPTQTELRSILIGHNGWLFFYQVHGSV